MITPYEKRLRVISCIIIAGSFAVTRPSVKIYFMGAVSQQVLAFSNLISIGLVALTSGLLENKKTVQALRRKWFAVFTVTDAIMYGVLSLAGFFIDPAIRFVGLSIADSLFTMTGSMLINDAVNVVLSGSGSDKLPKQDDEGIELGWVRCLGDLHADRHQHRCRGRHRRTVHCARHRQYTGDTLRQEYQPARGHCGGRGLTPSFFFSPNSYDPKLLLQVDIITL